MKCAQFCQLESAKVFYFGNRNNQDLANRQSRLTVSGNLLVQLG